MAFNKIQSQKFIVSLIRKSCQMINKIDPNHHFLEESVYYTIGESILIKDITKETLNKRTKKEITDLLYQIQFAYMKQWFNISKKRPPFDWIGLALQYVETCV